ncbi:MAG: hypothetical protein PHI14_00460 [Bacteroidales bacterium]|nr:hypothetical protein [Bacteroidales bacterium]
MKRIILIIAAICCIGLSTNAQNLKTQFYACILSTLDLDRDYLEGITVSVRDDVKKVIINRYEVKDSFGNYTKDGSPVTMYCEYKGGYLTSFDAARGKECDKHVRLYYEGDFIKRVAWYYDSGTLCREFIVSDNTYFWDHLRDIRPNLIQLSDNKGHMSETWGLDSAGIICYYDAKDKYIISKNKIFITSKNSRGEVINAEFYYNGKKSIGQKPTYIFEYEYEYY